jgi:coenzyme F420-reducing hydrogenase alpha subunit
MNLDKEIFKGKTLSELFGEIYDNSKETKSQVKALIGELKPLIENIGDATLLVPMIKEYMEIGVKNDEHLIKLATVIQRIESAQAKGESNEFDFSDLQDLLEEQEALDQQVEETKDEFDNDGSSNES